jgi:hypothetical protein
MARWRKVVEKDWYPTTWTLRLECGHDAYRSAQYSPTELPTRVLCRACETLIGSKVKTHFGKLGTIAAYRNGQFDVAWQNDGVTRSTLDELREEVEIVA